jgi:uncharacterized protein
MAKVWVLSAGRRGDLRQMQAVAAALNWPFEVKSVTFRAAGKGLICLWPDRYLASGSINPFASVELPDLVICAEATAGALAAKAKRAGGRFKLVCIGRPRGRFDDFDLIITSPQYGIGGLPNAVELPIAPHVLPEAVATPELHKLFQPVAGRELVAVLVGGTSLPDVLDEDAVVNLLKYISEEQLITGADYIVISGPRTGDAVGKMLASSSGVRFVPQSQAGAYGFALSVADRFLVTSDSVSMTAEALLTGKPVRIYQLPQRPTLTDLFIDKLAQFSLARPLFYLGLLETRPDRDRLFRSLAQRFRLDYPGVGTSGGDTLPYTAAHAAQLVRSLIVN